MAKAEILKFVRTMHARDHAILFYNNPQDKQEILFTFLKAGLDAGEATMYVASEETPFEIRRAMEQFGIDVRHFEKNGGLRILDYREWYLIDGQFDISRIFSQWEKALREALKIGFKGLRVAGEMSCFFKHGMINELVVYERALHQELELPMEAICAYDDGVVIKGIEDSRYLRLYLDLVAAHGTILFVGHQEAGIVRTV